MTLLRSSIIATPNAWSVQSVKHWTPWLWSRIRASAAPQEKSTRRCWIRIVSSAGCPAVNHETALRRASGRRWWHSFDQACIVGAPMDAVSVMESESQSVLHSVSRCLLTLRQPQDVIKYYFVTHSYRESKLEKTVEIDSALLSPYFHAPGLHTWASTVAVRVNNE